MADVSQKEVRSERLAHERTKLCYIQERCAIEGDTEIIYLERGQQFADALTGAKKDYRIQFQRMIDQCMVDGDPVTRNEDNETYYRSITKADQWHVHAVRSMPQTDKHNGGDLEKPPTWKRSITIATDKNQTKYFTEGE